MTELNTSEKHGASIFQRLALWLALRFSRHEARALKAARRAPFFAIFAPWKLLLVWLFLPGILIGLLGALLILEGGKIGAGVALFIGMGLVILIAPWFFRWYFICVGLRFGRTGMAQSKENEISERITRLERLKAARENQ